MNDTVCIHTVGPQENSLNSNRNLGTSVRALVCMCAQNCSGVTALQSSCNGKNGVFYCAHTAIGSIAVITI